MADRRSRLRDLHGRTAAVWGGDDVRVEPGRWVALSGVRAVDFNIALLHDASGGTAIPEVLEEIKSAGVPALVMVTGAALGEVQQLVRASWVCVGAAAFMSLDLPNPGPEAADAGVRRLERHEVARARELVAEVFGFAPELAATAVPDETADAPGRSVWGRFTPDGVLVSTAATMVVEDVVAAWSVATPPAHRRQGHADALLRGALAGAWADGARRCLLNSSPEGEPLYRALGFVELERWQMWSRPRWVLSRF